MGLDTPALYDSDETIARQLLASVHPSLAGITFEELKARGWMRLSYPDPFVPSPAPFRRASWNSSPIEWRSPDWNSIFANVPKQQRRSGAATLLIHPDDAALRHIATGDEVRIANARGAFFAVADVSDRIRPGVVASTKGRWPDCSKEGATINATVDERDSDIGGGALYHDNRVRVDKMA